MPTIRAQVNSNLAFEGGGTRKKAFLTVSFSLRYFLGHGDSRKLGDFLDGGVALRDATAQAFARR
jgi:hypothetical protein